MKPVVEDMSSEPVDRMWSTSEANRTPPLVVGQTSKQFFDMGSDPEKSGQEEGMEYRRALLSWMDDGHAGEAPLVSLTWRELSWYQQWSWLIDCQFVTNHVTNT